MTQELERQNIQSSGSGSATCTSSEGSTAKSSQFEIMSKVLGSRTDYQIGVGYMPRGKGKKSASSSSTSRSSSQAAPASSRPMTAQEGSMLADLLFKIRDKMESGNFSFDESLHDPRYDILRP